MFDARFPVEAFDQYVLDRANPDREARELSSPHFQLLYRAMGSYSDAYGALDRELAATPAALERAWPGEDGRAARQELASILDAVEDGFHDTVLGLTGPLDVIQRQHLDGDRPPRDELRRARAAVRQASIPLGEAHAELEARVARLMEALGGP